MERKIKSIVGWVVSAVIVVAIIVVLVVVTQQDINNPPPRDVATTAPSQLVTTQPATQPAPQPEMATPTKPAPQIPALNAEISAERAAALLAEGMKLAEEGKHVQARTALSEAVFSDKLAPADAELARTELWELAKTTIFSTHAFAGDPYTFLYKFQAGDRLSDRRVDGKTIPGLVSSKDLRVPSEAILMANNIRGTQFSAGREYKMIRGPFHAVIYKHLFVMDIYLQREGAPKTFIRRARVGLGKDDSTPHGSWIVHAKAGGKGTRATWYPPASSGLKGPISYGNPKYAFGEKGLWIQIEGIDPNTRGAQGYGIHSTADQTSIGKQSSLGCIRLADPDIDFVFKVLYEGHSTVWIRP